MPTNNYFIISIFQVINVKTSLLYAKLFLNISVYATSFKDIKYSGFLFRINYSMQNNSLQKNGIKILKF